MCIKNLMVEQIMYVTFATCNHHIITLQGKGF